MEQRENSKKLLHNYKNEEHIFLTFFNTAVTVSQNCYILLCWQTINNLAEN